jgi:hypothetical protein
MSEDVLLALIPEQAAEVMADAVAGRRGAELLAGLVTPQDLANSPLPNAQMMPRLLLCGLVVLACFPADGSWQSIEETADVLGLPTSRIYRYVHTLLAVGSLEQSPRTRMYRRVQPPRRARRR